MQQLYSNSKWSYHSNLITLRKLRVAKKLWRWLLSGGYVPSGVIKLLHVRNYLERTESSPPDWLIGNKKNPICQLLHESAVNLAKNIRELCQQKMITTPSFIFKPWIRVHFFIVLLALCFKLTPNLKSTCLVYMKLEIILLWSCKHSSWFNFGSITWQKVHPISVKHALH